MATDLRVEQLQLDDLYGKLRPRLGRLGPAVCWLYNAIDPVSKYWLGFEVGQRNLVTAQRLVHRVRQMLAPDHLPLIQTDGEASLSGAVLGHWGAWGQVETDTGLRRRWLPLPQLRYVQVIKRRLRRRVVSVSRRRVSGDEAGIRATLAAHGWGFNTAFIERFNLTLRRHVPGLQRRGLALARSEETLVAQLTLVQFYYNFCLPHTSLGTRRQPVTPAMALGLTDRVWRLEEGLLVTQPPRGSADWQRTASPA